MTDPDAPMTPSGNTRTGPAWKRGSDTGRVRPDLEGVFLGLATSGPRQSVFSRFRGTFRR